MKKLFCLIIVLFLFSGCGFIEKFYEGANYESLTNERGTIECYSGGVLVATHKNAKIIYSDSDAFSLWIKTSSGNKIYWQGEALIDFD